MRCRQEKNNNNQSPNFYRPSWRIVENLCLVLRIKELLLPTVGVLAGVCEILGTHCPGFQLTKFTDAAPVEEAISKALLIPMAVDALGEGSDNRTVWCE